MGKPGFYLGSALAFCLCGAIASNAQGTGPAERIRDKNARSHVRKSLSGQQLKLLCCSSGAYDLFISPAAVNLVSQSVGISVRAAAPDREVVLVRDDCKEVQRLPYARAMKKDLSPFFQYAVRKELVEPGKTRDARIQGRPCRVYSFKGDYDSSFAWKSPTGRWRQRSGASFSMPVKKRRSSFSALLRKARSDCATDKVSWTE